MSITAGHLPGIGLGRHRAVRPSAPARAAGTAAERPTPTRAVTWSTVDTGFHVASRTGEFVGSIDATDDGHFIAFDGTSSPIGRYRTLREAKTAVTVWVPERARARERELARFFRPVATSAAVVAGATAVAAAMITAAPL